jgi:hypothetical protein
MRAARSSHLGLIVCSGTSTFAVCMRLPAAGAAGTHYLATTAAAFIDVL